MVNKMLPDRPLSATELEDMNAFLISKGASTIFHMHGLSCGLGRSLEVVPAEIDSMMALLGHQSKLTLAEINRFGSFLIRLNREIVDELEHSKTFKPLIDFKPVVSFEYESLTDQQKQHLATWCGGYLLGFSADSERWGETRHRSNIKSLLLPIAILADTAAFDALGDKKDRLTAKERAKMLNEATLVLPSIVSMIYHFSQTQRLRAEGVMLTPRKVGRNDPCLCGSGKKFKKCCLSV